MYSRSAAALLASGSVDSCCNTARASGARFSRNSRSARVWRRPTLPGYCLSRTCNCSMTLGAGPDAAADAQVFQGRGEIRRVIAEQLFENRRRFIRSAGSGVQSCLLQVLLALRAPASSGSALGVAPQSLGQCFATWPDAGWPVQDSCPARPGESKPSALAGCSVRSVATAPVSHAPGSSRYIASPIRTCSSSHWLLLHGVRLGNGGRGQPAEQKRPCC